MKLTSKIEDIKTEVVVVGAGAAGLTAALAAARNGAKTILIEASGFLGGLSTTLPWLGFHDRDYRQVVKGLPQEFVQRLQDVGAAAPFEYDIKCSSVFSFDGHWWKCIAMQMCAEAGVRVMLHAKVVDTLREGDRITGVVINDKSGQFF